MITKIVVNGFIIIVIYFQELCEVYASLKSNSYAMLKKIQTLETLSESIHRTRNDRFIILEH